MTRRIKGVAPLQAGKMLGVLYACMGLIFLPIFALAGLAGAFAQQTQQAQNTGGLPSALIAAMMFGFGIFMPSFTACLALSSALFPPLFTTSLPAGSAASRSKSNN